jgi:hypothetical protein
MPIQKVDGGWLHPSRLPLGGGWRGHCSAPGHEGAQPSEHELQEFCNLGYATKCPRLPVDREFDSVRFSVARDQGSRLLLWFVCELAHRPANHGTLEYDIDRNQWICPHPEPRIQKMAECYVETYLQRRIHSAATASVVSENS